MYKEIIEDLLPDYNIGFEPTEFLYSDEYKAMFCVLKPKIKGSVLPEIKGRGVVLSTDTEELLQEEACRSVLKQILVKGIN